LKHCIIVKWKGDVDKKEVLGPVKELFLKAKEIPSVEDVLFIENCVDISNRYDLMIQVIIDKENLEDWNSCEIHKAWKENYGEKIEAKAIFDYE